MTKKMTRNGPKKVIYKGTFISKQSLCSYEYSMISITPVSSLSPIAPLTPTNSMVHGLVDNSWYFDWNLGTMLFRHLVALLYWHLVCHLLRHFVTTLLWHFVTTLFWHLNWYTGTFLLRNLLTILFRNLIWHLKNWMIIWLKYIGMNYTIVALFQWTRNSAYPISAFQYQFWTWIWKPKFWHPFDNWSDNIQSFVSSFELPFYLVASRARIEPTKYKWTRQTRKKV